jgi:hypothetical protein
MQLEALITHASMLEGRLRQLASKWRAQARHPQRRFRPAERELLHKHADELLGELNVDKLLRPRDKDGD